VDLDAFQAAAARTLNPTLSPRERLLDAAAGLAEEAGEVLGRLRKHLFQAHPLDREAVVGELGDVLWCLAAVATTLDVSLGAVGQANIEKLRRRYPHGFTPDASQARGDEATPRTPAGG
jgi:NTP pyrophosphatase (non-canonical NTP hydrolase)